MARKYSGMHGKSGSTKPSVLKKQVWVRYSPKEVELLIVKLAKQGMMSSKVGLVLRDTYGVPSVKLLTGKSISAILESKGIKTELPEDLLFLIRKYVSEVKHFKNNHRDMTAKRGITLTKSKIDQLIKYYKKTGKLSSDWKFDLKKAALYL